MKTDGIIPHFARNRETSNSFAVAIAAALFTASAPLPGVAEELSEKDKHNLERCLNAIVYGPEVKKVNILGHEYNCKRYESFQPYKDKAVISGQLSHHLSMRPDDQIRYSMTVLKNGVVEDVDVSVKRGGAGYVAKKVVGKVADFKKIDVTEEDLEDLDKAFRELGNLVDGKWEGSAEFIVAAFSARTAKSFADAFVSTRGEAYNQGLHGRMSYFVDRQGKDYKTYKLADLTPRACMIRCAEDRKCIAWTYVHPRINGELPACWLKDDLPEPALHERATSGGVDGMLRMDRVEWSID